MQEAEALIREQVLRHMRSSEHDALRATTYLSGLESVAPDVTPVSSGTTASFSVNLPSIDADTYRKYLRDSFELWRDVARPSGYHVHVSRLVDTINVSPFDELLSTRLAAVQHSLHFLDRRSLDKAIGDQLLSLFNEAQEEYPETSIPSPQTMISALTFFSKNRALRPPTLSLTPAGNVWAEWRRGRTHTAAFQFLRNGSINLAAIFSHPVETWREISVAGNFTDLQIAQLTGPSGLLSWLRR